MNDTTTNSAEQAIKDELRRLGWMIPDAQRRLNEHAQTMLRRAERAVKDMEAMMANQPCSMSWVDFAESDLRNAREAKAQLEFLYQQRTMLEFFLKKD
jgi:hypothetical protein